METGSCPHTAVREDPTMNLAALEALAARYPSAQVALLESGGDNLTLTFSRRLVDYSIYVIDVAGGDKIPRKRGPGLIRSDLLVINKVDLAPYVGASLEVMARDSEIQREGRPFLFTNCRTGEGVDAVLEQIIGGRRLPVPVSTACRPSRRGGGQGRRELRRLELGHGPGRTRLLGMRCRVPFHVGRVLHPQADWPELAHLLVTMPTGGFVQGDVATMAVLAQDGARVHLTSQSATRAYRCETAPIRQRITLEARGDSLLEWWPDPLIPYAGTSLQQEIELVVDERATVLVGRLLAGRPRGAR